MFKKIKLFYKQWVKFGKKVAALQVRIAFTVAYCIFIIPFGLILKIFSVFSKTGWQKVETKKSTIEDAKRQF